jgi:UDPglucose--hexose-1-phosphate uridylyltransferase
VPIIRKNIITNDWVIFSPNRARRPMELAAREADNLEVLKSRPSHKPDCPFCRGNEKKGNVGIFSLPGAGGWGTRVIENKFASLDRHARPDKRFEGLEKEMNGFGIHDVIIDNPRHNATIGLMSRPEIVRLLRAYRLRYRQIQRDDRVRHIVIFKNQGIKAGGSLEHPHSQIYGLPVIPFETRVRLGEAEKYFGFNDHCLFCDILKDERTKKKRVIYENDSFVCLMPYAALSPFHAWIAPKRHVTSFALITDRETETLADAMKVFFGKIFFHLRNPDFNYIIQSLSHYERESEYFHWYLSFIPQIKRKGGIEYAGGLFVNTVLPEDAAERLRKTRTDRPL